MPDGDGTGPRWGQGRWNCRRGFGRSRGFGRGWGFRTGYPAVPAVSATDEKAELKAYAAELEAELEEVKRRMASLGKD